MNATKLKKEPVSQNEEDEKVAQRHCGIIMPIAAMPPEYDAAHWIRVKDVISDAIKAAGFIPRLVSDSDEVGVIHDQIVQNLYDDDIVVCDVSGKNPNVMFELGMRLAFDKLTVIVKDDVTAYSFDTSPIKHIPYRKDQRYDDVSEFKQKVEIAIKATIQKRKADPHFSPFLRHFGTFTPKKLDNQELPQAEYIMKKLEQIEGRISNLTAVQGTAARIFNDAGNVWTQNLALRHFADPKPGSRLYVAVLKNLISNLIATLNLNIVDDADRAKMMIRRHILSSDESLLVGLTSDRFDELFDKAWSEVATKKLET